MSYMIAEEILRDLFMKLFMTFIIYVAIVVGLTTLFPKIIERKEGALANWIFTGIEAFIIIYWIESIIIMFRLM